MLSSLNLKGLVMHVISRKKLVEKSAIYHDAEEPLDVWYRITKRARWKNINEVRGAYPKADQVGTCVVFDIGGNKYRLITHIDYATEPKGKKKAFGGRVLTFDVLTHKEYDTDKWKTKYCGCK
jgi:mRNA interferase HigB